jgi:hypothetical protein
MTDLPLTLGFTAADAAREAAAVRQEALPAEEERRKRLLPQWLKEVAKNIRTAIGLFGTFPDRPSSTEIRLADLTSKWQDIPTSAADRAALQRVIERDGFLVQYKEQDRRWVLVVSWAMPDR